MSVNIIVIGSDMHFNIRDNLRHSLNISKTKAIGLAAIFVMLSTFSSAIAAEEQGICARVRIQLSQDVVITRNAFRATLEITNAPQNVPLENLTVTLNITDGNNQPVNSFFGINPPELSGVGDVNGGGVIQPGTTASASWLIVPTRDAAPDGPVMYYVGGEFSYTQDGSTITMPLFRAPILVKPDPLLVLDYFWVKDVYGDDPFTPEIEPAEPLSLGLMVRNDGKGVANNFRIISAQPQIIENEKGLLVDFKIIGAQVNSEPVSPSLAVNLGNIDPGTTSVAKWIMTSSLQGKFIDYKATFAHVDGLGNPRLSLIDTVNIHELTHAVRVDIPSDDSKPDFLVNDAPDDDHMPDTLYNSNGPIEPVSIGQNPSVDWNIVNGGLEAHLTATVPSGWVYIRVNDPGQDQYRLKSVIRSDGREILMDDNAWTTHRTIRLFGQAPYREHLLHLFDKDSTGSYTLVYEISDTADTTPPTLQMVTPVPTLSKNQNPPYTFSSSEAGTIGYSGSCSSTTTAAAAGNNTITLSAAGGGPLADGTYSNCTITVTDAAGNASSPLIINAFAVDTAAPIIAQVTQVPTPTKNQNPSYTFSSTEAGNISYGGSCSSTTTAAVAGNNTITLTASDGLLLMDGPYSDCTITVTDAIGNISNVLTINTFTVDITLPNAPSVSGTSPTNNTKPMWLWTSGGGGNGTYQCQLDSGAWAGCASPYIPANALAEGKHTLSVQERDDAGNWCASGSKEIIIDTTAPELIVSTLSDGSWTNNDTLNISGTTTDNMGIPNLTINGTSVTVNADGTFSVALTLFVGPDVITTVAADLAGNQTTDTRTINFDPTAPYIVITTPADNSKTKEPTIPVSGNVDESSVVTVKVNTNDPLPAEMSGNDFTLNVPLTYGINTIEVTARDLATNQSTLKRTVTSDDQNPSLSITEPAQDIRTNQESILLKGETTDITAITITVTKDQETYTPAVVNGQFEQLLTLTDEKMYQIYVTATDEVGNTTTVQRNIIYDITSPALSLNPVTNPVNNTSQILSGTVEATAVVTVICPTANVGQVSYPTETTWTVTLTNMAAGSNHIRITATDEAGNIAAEIATTIIVDTVPPDTSITSGPPNPTSSNAASFSFTSTEADSTFQCQLDGVSYQPCTSPKSYTNLTAGSHTFSVQATDAAGNSDPTSARYTWTIAQGQLPDLSGSWRNLTSRLGGRLLSGTLKIKNSGNKNAGSFKVTFYLSNDGVSISRALRTVSVEALRAGMTRDLSFTYTSLTSLSNKYIIAVVDLGNKVAETNENNNVAVARIP